MNFNESEKSKAIRWFRSFADLLESGKADLVPASLYREDYGSELRLSGAIVPSKNPSKTVSPSKKTMSKTPAKVDTEINNSAFKGRMTPAHAQSCYDQSKRKYVCPKCQKFETTSETGLKKHYNRCKS